MSLGNIAFDAGTTCVLLGLVLCLRYYATVSERVLVPLSRNTGFGLVAVGALLLILSMLG